MDSNSKNEIWLVRHAHSYFNMWVDWSKGRLKSDALTEEELSFVSSIPNKFDPKLLDPGLTHIGVRQAIDAQSAVNALPIQYVLVSPLQRTLESARIMFDTHPNKDNIQFIVLPIIREIIADPGDIPLFTLERMKPKYESLDGFHFDFSLMERAQSKDLFFLDTMEKSVSDKVMAEVEKGGAEKYAELMLKVMREMKKNYPPHHRKIELFPFGRKRCHAFAKYVSESFMKEKGVNGKNIMVVSHSVYLSNLIAQEFNDYGKAVCPKIPNAVPFLFDLKSIRLV